MSIPVVLGYNDALLAQDVLVKGTERGSSFLTNRMISVSTPKAFGLADFSNLEARLLDAYPVFKTNWRCKESVAKSFAAGVMLSSLEYDMESTVDLSRWYDLLQLTEKPKLTLLAEAIGFSKPIPIILSHEAIAH